MASSGGIDVLVVGGGLLGMCVALKASQRGHRVLVCRLSDAKVPQADTLRNQSWLQSGLRYVGESEYGERNLLAKRMLAGGNALYNELGLRPPKGFGIVRLLNDEEGLKLEKDAATHGVEVERLPEDAVAPALGELFVPGSPYYATPEIPFDEPMLLRRLRESVKDSGGLVCDITAPIELFPDESVRPFSFYVMLQGHRIAPPPVTVLAAGAGNVPLLQRLNLESQSQLELFQTPLLVLPLTIMRGVRIFQDKVRRFSVVSHPPSEHLPDGAMVIGTVDGSPTHFCPAEQRRIPPGDCDSFWHIDCFQTYRGIGRFTAGFEVAVNGKKPLYDWVATFHNYPGLIAAIPGRATLSMSVAETISGQFSAGASTPLPPHMGTAWTAPIYMHHEPYYANLNDLGP